MRATTSGIRQLFLLVLAGSLLWAAPLFAALTGDIHGLVLDAQSLPVPDAEVTLTNLGTGATRIEHTDGAGAFTSQQLDVGAYQIVIEKSGFRAYVLDQVSVRSGEVARFTATLTVGAASETVTVQAGAANYLDSADAEVATTFSQAVIASLPLTGFNANPFSRDPVSMAQLVPGVVPNESSALESGNFNANGQRGRSNNITVDNAIASDIITGEQAGTGTFTLESVQEFTVLTAGLPAEFGRNSGSQVQIVTKGGTNEFHGAAFWFFQNSALDAKNFFLSSVPPSDSNDWGGTVGGPIVKKKVFFNIDYQGVRVTGRAGSQAAAVLTTAQAAGITDPTSLALFNAVGAPQSAGGSEINTSPNDQKAYSWSLRLDENANGGKDIFTERYSTSPVTAVNPSFTFDGTALPNYGAVGTGSNYFLNAGWTHTFSPTLINQVRFQYSRLGNGFQPFTTLTAPYAPLLNIEGYPLMGVAPNLPQSRLQNVLQYSDALSWTHGLHSFKFGGDIYQYQDAVVQTDFDRGEFYYSNVAAFQGGEPFFYIQGFGNPARNFRSLDVDGYAQDDIRATPTVTINIGVRLESAGGVSEANNQISNLDESGTAPVGGGGTGPLGSIQLGGSSYKRNYNWAPRIGAAWNPRKGKLVVRAGYGWIYDFLFLNPIVEQQFTAPYFVGFSYSGAAMSGANSYADFAAGTAAAQQAAAASVGTFPSNEVNFGSIDPVQQNLKNPVTQQWNAGVEYQLARNFVLKATYIGSVSKNLQVSMPINLVAPQNRVAPATSLADEMARFSQFAAVYEDETGTANGSTVNDLIDHRFNSVTQLQSVGQASYEGLQIQAIKVLSHGFSIQGSYTYSHTWDDISDAIPDTFANDSYQVQNPLNLASNWAPSAFDIRQRFVVNGLFVVPWTKGFKHAEGKVLDGWQVGAVAYAQSGFPASVFSGPVLGIPDVALLGGGAELANGNTADFQPAVFGSAAAAAIPGLCARGIGTGCTNTSGFPLTQPLLGNFGNSGRNSLRLAGSSDVDLGVYKNTPVNERVTIQFRWEIFNLLNHPNFSGFVNNLAAPDFGTYTTTANSPRVHQFGIKVLF